MAWVEISRDNFGVPTLIFLFLFEMVCAIIFVIVGKCFSAIVESLFSTIDQYFEFENNEFGKWLPDTKLTFVQLSPLLAPLGILIGFVGVVLAVLFGPAGLFGTNSNQQEQEGMGGENFEDSASAEGN